MKIFLLHASHCTKNPTINTQYSREKLEQLLDQRWAGHLDTVAVILKSFDTLAELSTELETSRTGADRKIEAVGLQKAITAANFEFIANMIYKVLGLSNPFQQVVEGERTVLITVVQLIQMF